MDCVQVLTNTAQADYRVNDIELFTQSSVAFERRRMFMPCPYFVGTGCGCGGCTRFVRTTAVAVVGANLQLTVPSTTVHNHQRLCICIAQAIPGTVTPNMPVTVLIGATVFTVYTRCGNRLYADQVKSRTVLHVTAATDTPLLTLCDTRCLCPTSHVFPVINPVVVVNDGEDDAPDLVQGKAAKKV